MSAISKFLSVIFLISMSGILKAQTDQAAEMQAWMDYAKPGKFHEMLAKDDGDWTGEVSMWMDPTAPPTVSTGNCSNKMILGGRYQQSTFTMDMMGMPFEGINILGYDNAKKMFVSSWVDNFGTGILNMQGTLDEATNTINLTGKQTDPVTGKDIDVRETFKVIDANNQVMEMYMTINGVESKSMEVKYKRK